MPKHIVLLSDGTGNSAGKFFKTNVWRLYQALDLAVPDPTLPQQIAYYDDGVGTSSFRPLAIIAGAFGWGLKQNVIDLYTFLCRNYKEGDQIYGFGFSRGAFTIRVLTGLLQNQGLVQGETEAELRQKAIGAFRAYRRRYTTVLHLERPARAIRDRVVQGHTHICGAKTDHPPEPLKPPITFLGLWDTVAAYGLPIDELTRAWNAVFPLSTPNRELCENVQRACHALALDDERNTFHPVLWNEEGHPSYQHVQDEKISQVWFAGMHANVGGGYPDDALANVSLDWIMGEAERAGLRFKTGERDRVKTVVDSCGKLYNSRHGLGGTYRYLPRDLKTLTNDDRDNKNKVIIKRPKIHESVFERIQRGIDGYAPIVLPAHYAVVTAEGAIVDLETPPTPGKLVESVAQAKRRAKRQEEEVWNLVWCKRVTYFTSIFWVLALVAFPLYYPATDAHESRFASLSWALSGLGMLLPDFANPWLKAYQSYLGQFILLLLILGLFIYAGNWLQHRGFDKMRAIWKSNVQGPELHMTPLVKLLHKALYRFRAHWLYQGFFRLMKWKVLPLIVGLAALLAIGEGISQQIFATMSSFGYVCTPRETREFSTNELCWASGVEVEPGKRYRITITMQEPWWDGKGKKPVKTGVGGFGREQMTPVMYLGLPMRRHVTEPWFKPIARIGAQGSDEYPLNPVDASIIPNKEAKVLVAEITARRQGELFLFVNDAVLPVPKHWQWFYDNNQGTATVTVQPVGNDWLENGGKVAHAIEGE